jgi:outer membrane protein
MMRVEQIALVAVGFFASVAISGARGQPATPVNSAVSPARVQAVGPDSIVKLDSVTLVQALTLQNLEIAYANESTAVAASLAQAEAALYEPVLFGSNKRYITNRQRTAEEKMMNLAAASDGVIFEGGISAEVGVRQKVPIGGDLSLSVRNARRDSNILMKSGVTEEMNSVLAFSYKQPLLKGYGTVITEADKLVAQRESDVAQWQFRQQLLKVVAENLSTYWQASAANEIVALRQELIQRIDALHENIAQRVQAGKLPPRAISEVMRMRSAREAEHLKAQQMRDDLVLKLLSSLNLPEDMLTRVRLPFTSMDKLLSEDTQFNTEDALNQWSPYQIARLRKEQGQLRLNYALNQSKPGVDFVMSYSPTGLGDRYGSFDMMRSGKYQEWTVGFNIELGAFGAQKASRQAEAQARRLNQSDLEMDAIRTAFLNDLSAKRLAALSVERELAAMARDVRLRDEYRREERERFDIGVGLLGQWIQAEVDFAEARIRQLEAMSRLQISRVSLQLAEGKLLQAHGVESPLPTVAQ